MVKRRAKGTEHRAQKIQSESESVSEGESESESESEKVESL